jgi:hypothetical protein
VSDPTPSPAISDKDANKLQQLTGTLLYYAKAVDPTLIMSINVLPSELKHHRSHRKQGHKTAQLLQHAS